MKIIHLYILFFLLFPLHNHASDDHQEFRIIGKSGAQLIIADNICRFKYMINYENKNIDIKQIKRDAYLETQYDSHGTTIIYKCFGSSSKNVQPKSRSAQFNNIDFELYLPYDLFYEEFNSLIEAQLKKTIDHSDQKENIMSVFKEYFDRVHLFSLE